MLPLINLMRERLGAVVLDASDLSSLKTPFIEEGTLEQIAEKAHAMYYHDKKQAAVMFGVAGDLHREAISKANAILDSLKFETVTHVIKGLSGEAAGIYCGEAERLAAAGLSGSDMSVTELYLKAACINSDCDNHLSAAECFEAGGDLSSAGKQYVLAAKECGSKRRQRELVVKASECFRLCNELKSGADELLRASLGEDLIRYLSTCPDSFRAKNERNYHKWIKRITSEQISEGSDTAKALMTNSSPRELLDLAEKFRWGNHLPEALKLCFETTDGAEVTNRALTMLVSDADFPSKPEIAWDFLCTNVWEVSVSDWLIPSWLSESFDTKWVTAKLESLSARSLCEKLSVTLFLDVSLRLMLPKPLDFKSFCEASTERLMFLCPEKDWVEQHAEFLIGLVWSQKSPDTRSKGKHLCEVQKIAAKNPDLLPLCAQYIFKIIPLGYPGQGLCFSSKQSFNLVSHLFSLSEGPILLDNVQRKYAEVNSELLDQTRRIAKDLSVMLGERLLDANDDRKELNDSELVSLQPLLTELINLLNIGCDAGSWRLPHAALEGALKAILDGVVNCVYSRFARGRRPLRHIVKFGALLVTVYLPRLRELDSVRDKFITGEMFSIVTICRAAYDVGLDSLSHSVNGLQDHHLASVAWYEQRMGTDDQSDELAISMRYYGRLMATVDDMVKSPLLYHPFAMLDNLERIIVYGAVAYGGVHEEPVIIPESWIEKHLMPKKWSLIYPVINGRMVGDKRVVKMGEMLLTKCFAVLSRSVENNGLMATNCKNHGVDYSACFIDSVSQLCFILSSLDREWNTRYHEIRRKFMASLSVAAGLGLETAREIKERLEHNCPIYSCLGEFQKSVSLIPGMTSSLEPSVALWLEGMRPDHTVAGFYRLVNWDSQTDLVQTYPIKLIKVIVFRTDPFVTFRQGFLTLFPQSFDLSTVIEIGLGEVANDSFDFDRAVGSSGRNKTVKTGADLVLAQFKSTLDGHFLGEDSEVLHSLVKGNIHILFHLISELNDRCIVVAAGLRDKVKTGLDVNACNAELDDFEAIVSDMTGLLHLAITDPATPGKVHSVVSRCVEDLSRWFCGKELDALRSALPSRPLDLTFAGLIALIPEVNHYFPKNRKRKNKSKQRARLVLKRHLTFDIPRPLYVQKTRWKFIKSEKLRALSTRKPTAVLKTISKLRRRQQDPRGMN